MTEGQRTEVLPTIVMSPEVIDPATHPRCYGPNFPTPHAEQRALRAQARTGWFDAWAFALLLLCIAVIPTLWLLDAAGRLSTHWAGQ